MRSLYFLFIVALGPIGVDAQDTLKLSGMGNVKVLPVLWQQHSAEYKALCYQAFNFAACRLHDMKLKKRIRYAIITDVDETVLDNSYYEASRILLGREFDPVSWKEWTLMSKATPVPGALEFLQLAKRRGVEIFYVSNRDTTEVDVTVINLRTLGFPDADEKHMLFLENSSSKEDRRQLVMKNHRVIMMLGDNLNDFSSIFEKKQNDERSAETARLKDDWGKTFIVIPNATYGEWENALYDYSRKFSPAEKEIALKRKLVTIPR